MTVDTLTREDTGEMLPVRVADRSSTQELADITARAQADKQRAMLSIRRRLDRVYDEAIADALDGARLPKHRTTAEDLLARRHQPQPTGEWPRVQTGSVKWAELPADPVPTVFTAIRSRYGTIGEPSPFDPNPPTGRPVRYDKDQVQAQLAARFGPAPDENMPGRVPGDGNPVLAAAYRGERPMPALTPAIEGTYTHPQTGRYRGPRSPLWRRVDRALLWLERRFTPVKEQSDA